MNKQDFLNSLKQVQKNKYGEYIYVGADNIPTGCWEGMEEFTWLQEYEKENPSKVTEWIEYKEPTEEEMLLSMTEEQRANYHREKRDSLINNEIWKLQRHEQEKMLGINTTLTDEQYLTILNYIQSLRKLPQQPNFPNEVIYPERPE